MGREEACDGGGKRDIFKGRGHEAAAGTGAGAGHGQQVQVVRAEGNGWVGVLREGISKMTLAGTTIEREGREGRKGGGKTRWVMV